MPDGHFAKHRVVSNFFSIFLCALLLTSCEFVDYFNDLLGKSTNFEEPSISFAKSTFYLSKENLNEGQQIELILSSSVASYGSLVTYSVENSTIARQEGNFLYAAAPFTVGKTLLRASITTLGIEAVASVETITALPKLDSYEINGVANAPLPLDEDCVLTFSSSLSSSIPYDDLSLSFNHDDDGFSFISKDANAFHVRATSIGREGFSVTSSFYGTSILSSKFTCALDSPVVEARAREILGKSADDIVSEEELAGIKELDDGSSFVSAGLNDSNLDCLKFFPETTSLNLSGNLFKNPTISLPKLEELTMDRNSLKGFVLSNPEKITDLSLEGCGLSSFDFTVYPALEYLSLRRNSLSSVTIENPGSLWYLDIGENSQITSVSATNGLGSLQRFLAPDDGISDLSFLSSSPDLKVLDVANNNVTSLGPISGLVHLDEIYLGGNPGLASASFLSDIPSACFSNFVRINVGGSSSFTPATQSIVAFLKNCPNLQWMQVYGLGLTDISWVNETSYPSLMYIKCSHNNITDYSSLGYITAAGGVVVSDNTDTRQ